jgi:hypothetical protein
MPKRTSVRIIDNRRTNRATTISGVTLSAPAPGVSDHGLLLGLGDDDHPHYLLANGGRALAGNLAVANGVTVDGVDISAHAGDPAAHHAPVTAGTLISLSGQQVSVANGAAYQFIGTGGDTVPEWRTVSEFAGNGLAATNGVLAVGVANTGATGLSVEADAVRLTSSSNPGAAASVLASDASGYLSLVRLTLSDRVRTPLIDTASGNLTVQPAGDLVLDPVGNDVLPASNYDINLGMISRKYLTLHAAELWVETLVAQNTIATIGGRILVGPTTYLSRDMATGDTTIYVRHNQMVSGDRAYMEADGKVEFFAITSAPTTISATEYSYTVTRNLDGSGANAWYAGDALFNTGQAGNGFIDLYSLRGVKSASQAGPTIVGNVRNSATYNDWSEAWAIGNLNGLYGYGTNTVGVGLGKYASGQPNIVIDPTNGVRLRQYNTDMIVLDAAGNSYFAGVMTIGAGGEIRQGTGTLGSTFTGLRLWRDSNVGRIGGYNNNTLQWYGDTVGNFVAGAGYVLLNASGIRQTVANVKSASTEPSLTPIAPAINQRLSFYDSADSDDWGYTYPGGTDYDYFYPGMEWLRLYVSSQHFVQPQPYTTAITANYHVYDAVIEMPDNTFTTNAGIIQRRRLMLKAPAIELDSSSVTVQNAPVAVTTGATFTGQLVRDVATSAHSAGFLVRTAGALATTTNDDYLTIFHLADNEMAIGVADASAWRTLVLQPYGGTVDVRGRILAAAVGYAWSELTPQNGWSNYGTPNATFGVKRFGDQISVKGLVRATTTIASNTALNVQLAAEYRPAAGRSFACMASIGGAKAVVRVYVDSSGYIRPQDGFNSNDWLSVEFTYFTGG